MTDLPPITGWLDTWVNNASNRRGQNYSGGPWVQVQDGQRRGLLRTALRGVRGSNVLTAPFYARIKDGHTPGTTYTITPITSKWSPGDVAWKDQPTVNTAAGVTVDEVSADGIIEFDLTLIAQAVAAGGPWYGLRLTTNSTTPVRFYANDSGKPAWEWRITTSEAPQTPTNLRPDGGPIGVGDPPLGWDYLHLGDDASDQARSQVQVDFPTGTADPDAVAPDYDSGWQTNPDPMWDLATVGYTYSGQPRICWRVRVEDADTHQSEWSDWAEFFVDPDPTLVVDSPIGPFGDPEPTILAHLEGGTLSHWTAIATTTDRSDIRLRSGVKTGDIEWTIPMRNLEGRRVFPVKGRRPMVDPDADEVRGWVRLRARDDKARVEAIDHPVWVEAWIPLKFDDDLGVVPPETLTVSQLTHGDPRHVWQFTHNEPADAYLFEAEGRLLARVEPDDMDVDAGLYTWHDNGHIPPMRAWTLSVRAVENGKRSTPATYDADPYVAEGFWVLPEAEGIGPIVLDGDAVRDFLRTDRVATFEPLEGPELDIIYDTPPRKGVFDGWIGVDSPYDVWETRDAIDALSASSNRRAQVVWGSESQYARIADPDSIPENDINEDNLKHRAVVRVVGLDD